MFVAWVGGMGGAMVGGVVGGWLGDGWGDGWGRWWGAWAGWAVRRPSWGLWRWIEGVDLNVNVKGLPSGLGASQDAGCRRKGTQGGSWALARVPRADTAGNMELDLSLFLQLDRMPQVPSPSEGLASAV